MVRIIAIALVAVLITACAFSEETERLGTIVVTPSRLAPYSPPGARSVTVLDREELNASAYDAIPDRIGDVSGTDIRRRGPEGVQSDINIRATTFEQNTVLIDGVKVNDPQTGHFNMDLPVTVSDVDRIEILKGPASSVYGANAFGGVINIITKRPSEKAGLVIDSTGGSFDYYRGSLAATIPAGIIRNRFSIEESRSTGYMPETQFNILSLTDSAYAETALGDYDFLFGYTLKDFGADSFYSNLDASEHERTDTRFFKIAGNIENGPLKMNPRLFLRRHSDKFALDSNRPGWQTNYHTNYSYGGELDFVLENPFMDVSYGIELTEYTIDSTNLQEHGRFNNGMYAELVGRITEKLFVNLSMREDYYSDFGWEYAPSVNASYSIFDWLKLRGLAGRSYRVPTFTDLYYVTLRSVGNTGLHSESSWTYEAGAESSAGPFDVSCAYFCRNSRDTIDWIRSSPLAPPWRASNIGTSDTNGFELSLKFSPRRVMNAFPVTQVGLDYTALDVFNKHDYVSLYALDYLKQQICGIVDCDIAGFKNSWVLNFKKRIGDSGYVTVDMKLAKDVIKKDALFFEVFLEITNLFNASYSEQSSIPMPGRWIKSGGRLKF